MKYSIIIPTYNHCDLLKACIESIIAYTDLSDCEIIVVANGCNEESRIYLDEMYEETPNCSLMWFNKPLGYTKATNEGIKNAKGRFIVLLNNDTVLLPQPKNEWLRLLHQPFLEHSSPVGVTGPMKEKTETIDREFILFFCAMIPKRMFDEIGLLDEIFSPGYGEDTDFCIRAENAGYAVVQVPEEKKTYYADKRQTGNFPIFHHGNETFKHHPDPDLIHRNNAIIKERYGSKIIGVVEQQDEKPDIVYTEKDDIPKGLFQSSDIKTQYAENDELSFKEAKQIYLDNKKKHDNKYKKDDDNFDGFKGMENPPRETGTMPEDQKDDIPELLFKSPAERNKEIVDFLDITGMYSDEKGIYGPAETIKFGQPNKDAYGFPIDNERIKKIYEYMSKFEKKEEPEIFSEQWRKNLREHQDRMLNPVKEEKSWYEQQEEVLRKDFLEGEKKWAEDLIWGGSHTTNKDLLTVDIERAKTIDGFMADTELEYLAKLASKSKVFIEVGSWHGKSSRAIADNLPEGGVLYCVDTWKGSENEQDTHHASAKDKAGDGAFLWFLDSCFDLIQEGKIIPLRMDSVNAAKFFEEKYIVADTIFIDANHTYPEVTRDILKWSVNLEINGTICGHDYGTPNQELDGVTRAVNDIYPDVQIEPYTSIWVKDFSKKVTRIPIKDVLPETYAAHQKEINKAFNIREPKVFDCFPFNNELDILEIRFNELYEVVDRFIIVEAKYTHAGNRKELVFHNNLKRFEKFLNKVTYLVIEQFPDYSNLEFNDQNWARERYQRDYIMNGLKDCQDDDIIIISDCDEIPYAESVWEYTKKSKDNNELDMMSFRMDLYYYNLNTKSTDSWNEAKIVRFNKLKSLSPCGVRYHGAPSLYGGWHFSYFGSTVDIIKKIEATAHQEYNKEMYKDPIEINYLIHKGKDVFGRDNVKFEKIELSDDLPKWLLEQYNPLLYKYHNPQ